MKHNVVYVFVILVDDDYCVAIHDLSPVLTALFSIELGGFNSSKPAGATPCSSTTDNTKCAGGVRIVFFSEQKCDLVTVLVLINQILLPKNPYSVHMRVFEILLIFEAT